MAITQVGSLLTRTGASPGTIDLTSLGLQQDDVVVVLDAVGSNATIRNVGVTTSGYADIDVKLVGNDNSDALSIAQYKVMGASPDTSVGVVSTGSSTDARRTLVLGLRGCDPTDVLSAAAVVASGANTRLVGSPGSITPDTAGSVIFFFGTGATVTGSTTVYDAPSDLTDWYSAVVNSASWHCVVGLGRKDWTSGAFTPNAWTGPAVVNTDSWTGWLVAFKPASTGVTGQASSQIDLSGSASGQVTVTGQAASDLTPGASATGSVTVQGTASTAIDLTGSATGTVGASGVTGQAASQIDLTGSAAGKVTVSGQASADLTPGQSAQGTVLVRGSAAGAIDIASSAAGTTGAPTVPDAWDYIFPVEWRQEAFPVTWRQATTPVEWDQPTHPVQWSTPE